MKTNEKKIGVVPASLSQQAPPTLQEVRIYFSEKEMPEQEADAFYAALEKSKWIGKKGKKLYRWKGEAFRWMAIVLKKQPWLFSRKAR